MSVDVKNMPLVFKSELKMKILGESNYVLTAAFLVKLGPYILRVPRGFKTDLASVPRIPIIYSILGGIGHRAAVLHDYLYATADFSREDCDLIFYKALTVSNVNSMKAWIMYRAVRIAGVSHYGIK